MFATPRSPLLVRWCRNLVAKAGLATALVLAASPAHAQEPLSFFKNYFVTGDYVVRGVSLWRKGVNGKAVADIPPLGGTGGVPDQSDIVAAFLYVQTAESVQGSGIDHAKFMGIDLGPFTASGSVEPGSGTFAKPLVPWDTASRACWPVSFPSGRRIMTYRVDALRFLPINATTGKQDLTKPFRVVVPDAGTLFGDSDESTGETSWSSKPRAIGAALVVVYRDPNKPFSSIVIYDGAYTKRALARMVQPIEGFYQASVSSPVAKMTHIAGDGGPLRKEQVFLGSQLIATNPFVSATGRRWDIATFNNLPLPGGAQDTTVSVDRFGLIPDCVTYSAIVLQTTVQDTDTDGLLDRWETESNIPDVNDPSGATMLPNLAAMGAKPDHKDLFVEIGYMDAAEGTTYGGAPKPQHSHLPDLEALNKAADAFNTAPVSNPDGTGGIRVHFDVGNAYQPPPGCESAWQPGCAIIPAPYGRGGKRISETQACQNTADLTSDIPIECVNPDGTQGDMPGQYPKYPGTVGWKTGFQYMRDAILGFDRNRKDIFHDVLFAHSVGIPKKECLNPDGSADHVCQDTEADFHVPRTNSGIADFPGGDVLITLGWFDDEFKRPVGTPFMQGATLMHELGHNFELTHAGLQSLDPNVAREPNCKPNYHSVMNYLYQLRGLPDQAGIIHMDYSAERLAGLDEFGLTDGLLMGDAPRYRTGWYAPLFGSYLQGLAAPATKHCDGSELSAEEQAALDAGHGMVRVDAAAVGNAIDWNADGSLNPAGPLDINFNGRTSFIFNGVEVKELNAGTSDWANLRLNQLGGRRSPGGYYIDIQGRTAVGPLSLDVGRGDIGRGDIGRGDIGRGDIGRGDIGRGDIGIAIGRGDIGRGDIGRGDIGSSDAGRGDIGRGDIGRGDIGRGDIGRGVFGGGDADVGGVNEPFSEIDLETARAVSGDAPSPANELQACLTDDGECAGEGGDRPVLLTWQAPHLDQPISYSIYRFEYDPEAVFPPATLPPTPLTTVGGDGTPPIFYYDNDALAGRRYAYFIVANFAGRTSSGISNFAQVTTPAAPVRIDGIALTNSTLTIGGPLVPYTATVINQTAATLGSIVVQGYIDQGAATRAAGGALIRCDAGEFTGILPPGTCLFDFTLLATNATQGTGTLAPGAATARFELRQSGTEINTLIDTFTMPVTLVDATVPVPLAPINSAAIPQNNRAIDCLYDEARGRGYQIVFQWRAPSSTPTGISGYNIIAMHDEASGPIVNAFVTGTQYVDRSCNAFVADVNLTGWHWQVQPVNSQGVPGPWSPMADFQFERCLLDDGVTSCYAIP